MKKFSVKFGVFAVSSILMSMTMNANAALAQDSQITGSQLLHIEDPINGAKQNTYAGSQDGTKAFKITDYNNFTSPASTLDNAAVKGDPNIIAGTANDVANAQGFKTHTGSTTVPVSVLGQSSNANFPYTSVYKTYGNNVMNIGMVNGVTQISVFGNIANVPTTGSAVMGYASTALKPTGSNVYKGDAMLATLPAQGSATPANVQYGTSSVQVDFGAKTIENHMKFTNADGTARHIFIDGNISGTTFTGTLPSAATMAADTKYNTISATDKNNPFTMTGGFYGQDVQYIGGVFNNGSAAGSQIGTFGAAKVPKF